MTHTKLLRLLAFGSLGALSAMPILAQDSYTYFGLGAGRSRVNFDDTGLAQSFLGTGLTPTMTSRDEKDTAYKLFGGYQFNRNIALELGYFDLGKFGYTVTTVPAGTFATTLAARGASLDLVGTMPLGESWALLARVGLQYARTRDSFNGSAGALNLNAGASKSETNGKVGLGVQYAFSPGFMMRAEVERYRISDAAGGHGNVGVTSLSLVFPMGRMGTAPRVAAAPAYVAPAYVAPAYVAPAPPPMVAQAPPPMVVAPVVVTPAPAPTSRRVSFSAETLFGFDQSTMRPDGKAALDSFTAEITGMRYDTLSVEGHTDRLGSNAYNQTLSQQRAESVKAYLVASGKIDAQKVNTSGKGETTPVTKPGDCKGGQANASLIACLQPDRRVDIEVVGVR